MVAIFEDYRSKRELLLQNQQDERDRRKSILDTANQKLNAKEKELSKISKGGGLEEGILAVSGVIILFMFIFANGSDAIVVPFFGIIIGAVITVVEKGVRSRKQEKIAELQNEVQELRSDVHRLSE